MVDNFTKIKGFNFNLDKGLVYTTVDFERKFFSILAMVENNKVEFDRIPVQEYLKNTLKEEQ